jgi:hypothetical protein
VPSSTRSLVALLTALGLVAVLGWAAAVSLYSALDDRLAERAQLQAPPTDPPVEYRLTVLSDGCTVERSETPPGGDADSLTWSVLDEDGFQIAGIGAGEEPVLRWPTTRPTTVVLVAYGSDSYVEVSNRVTVLC